MSRRFVDRTASLALGVALTASGARRAAAEPPPGSAPVVEVPAPSPATSALPAATLVPPPAADPAAPAGHWVFVADPGSSAGTPAPPATTPPLPNAPSASRGAVYQRANTWDLNVDGAFGRFLGDDVKWTGFVRARAGLLFVREPLYDAIGLTYEYSSLEKATFGVQAEVLHLDSGLWGQLGGLLDVGGRPGIMAALGFSLIGVEAQYRTYEGLGDGIAVYAKLRVPIGVLAYVLGTRDAKKQATPPSPSATPTDPR